MKLSALSQLFGTYHRSCLILYTYVLPFLGIANCNGFFVKLVVLFPVRSCVTKCLRKMCVISTVQATFNDGIRNYYSQAAFKEELVNDAQCTRRF